MLKKSITLRFSRRPDTTREPTPHALAPASPALPPRSTTLTIEARRALAIATTFPSRGARGVSW
jgi:hypothetical protein